MNRRRISVALVALSIAGAVASIASAGPITKQNGSSPVLDNFTSICAVPGYANFGYCGGNPATFANIKGRINAVQPKAGVWNLGLTFTNLQPGATYRLWGNRNPAAPSPGVVDGFFLIATAVAGADGSVEFSYQTTDPSNLGFDLNILPSGYNGVTVVTSYWSHQRLQVSGADGTLSVSGA